MTLGVVVIGSGILAVQLHRNGHTQGDDFALYLRQARSLFDGDIGAVLADNRFSVLNSDAAFSPLAYPWGWPLLLSPFVHLWGYDYDRLKLVEVGIFMVWLVLLHGIVRRRIGRLPALAIVAVIATAPVFLLHTDQLLTEFPHLAAVGVFIWWYDRVRSRSTLLTASRFDLIVLGAMVTLVFNVRREGDRAARGDRRDAALRPRCIDRRPPHPVRVRRPCPCHVAGDHHPVRCRSPSRPRCSSCCCRRPSCPTTATRWRSSTTDSVSSPARSPISSASAGIRSSASRSWGSLQPVPSSACGDGRRSTARCCSSRSAVPC